LNVSPTQSQKFARCRESRLDLCAVVIRRCYFHYQHLLFASALASLVVLSGCSGDGRLDVAKVRGKVTYKGHGVPQATVLLFRIDPPDEMSRKLHPYAYVQPDGSFEIKTYVEGDGAPPGKYRVSIMAPTAGGTSKKDQPAEAQSASAPGVRVPAAIAAKFANVETAGLEIDVNAGENNLPPFELSADGGGSRATTSITPAAASTKN
jgi:hypothetical protein